MMYDHYTIQSDCTDDFIVLYDKNGKKIAQVGIESLLLGIGHVKEG